MKRIATPMVGGVVTSTLMELLAYPAIFFLWRRRSLPTGAAGSGSNGSAEETRVAPSSP
jgi:Cu(I)/Ag(I) efflux system membrane protein CusA/SilA